MSEPAKYLTVEDPKTLRTAIENAMKERGEVEGLQEVISTTKPPGDTIVETDQTPKARPTTPGAPKGDIKTRQVAVKPQESTPIPKGKEPMQTEDVADGGLDPFVSLPGTPDENQAPPSESASGVRQINLPGNEHREPQNDLEAFEMYMEEEFDRKLAQGLEATRTLAEDRYTALVNLLTKLQRRVEILEQRSAPTIMRPLSVDLSTVAAPAAPIARGHPNLQQGSVSQPSTDHSVLVDQLLQLYPSPPTKVVRHVCIRNLLKKAKGSSENHSNDPTDKEWNHAGLLSWLERN